MGYDLLVEVNDLTEIVQQQQPVHHVAKMQVHGHLLESSDDGSEKLTWGKQEAQDLRSIPGPHTHKGPKNAPLLLDGSL
jgi:hypothetical protein